jgi:predicted ATPase/DNA-binding winged helix-turn-helix (wHTH) protein
MMNLDDTTRDDRIMRGLLPRELDVFKQGSNLVGKTSAIQIASDECYSFTSFRLYPKQRALVRGSSVVAIGGRAFDVLLLLVSKAGTVVSFSGMMNFVWPNVIVEEANLRVQIALLRKILCQCELAQRAIETIPMRGYCFTLPVRQHPGNIEPESQKLETNPPVPKLLNPIIGREDTIEIITAALDERRLVTITGPGGIGKTTVAVAVANRFDTKFPGSIIFVDLSRACDSAAATLMIAQALGVEAQGDVVSALCDHLRVRDILLILDTCDHIVEPIAALAEAFLSHCTNLKLLITSREALRAIGEWTHRLPSLTFPEEGEKIDPADIESFSAVALFIECVRSSIRFEVQDRDLPVLAEICRRLDGIPLALEFAAARVSDLGLHEIASHLDDRFAILTRGHRTALPRHRTLSAALDWSYSLLSDDEQRMLRHLASLGRSFTVDHAVASDDGAICDRPVEAISSLYEKSLLMVDIRDDVPIYHLLDTTTAYVLERGIE